MLPLALEIADLTWRPAGSDRLTLDLRGTSISLPAGGLLLVSGASGAGKSTLLRAIAGMLGTVLPGELQGRLLVGGVDLVAAAATESGIPRGLSERLGFVAAGPAPTYALPLLLDDAALPLESRGVPTEEMRSRIERYARDAAVEVALIDRSLTTFSGGERAAAAALVALVASPDLLIADEPLGGLDARSAERLAATLRESGATRVIAAHDLSLLSSVTAVRINLENGRVVATAVVPAAAPAWSEMRSDVGGGAPIVQLVRATAEGRTVGPSSLAVMRGVTTLLTGDTGSGKSTLLHLVAGTLPLDEGERIATPELQIRFAPQDSGLLLGARPARALIAVGDAARAEVLAQRLDVTHLLDTSPGRLSDGERRRLAIVVTLAAAPDVLLLDEPSGGLDDARVAALCDLLGDRELLGTSAVLIATHDPRLSALSRPDARPLRRVRHPVETGSSVEIAEGGLAALLPAPAARVAESAERLLSPELGRRLIGTANPLTRLGLSLFWFALAAT
ncbi:MAG: ATP-binding cassette domain-containing protein, partial [Chloroflexi bacterium]|nr:ATP-binding cassette domain-containing protein [Chloroflexota bacterium]